MRIDGRPEDLEDFLIKHKQGQWFTWSDTKNKTYVIVQIPKPVYFNHFIMIKS